MNPGKFNHYVSLLRLDTSLDAMGGVVKSWTFIANVWAQWLPTNGREFIAAQTRIAEAAGMLRINYRSDVDATWRVVVDGVTFEIAAPPLWADGQKRYLDLVLKQARVFATQAPLVNVFSVSLPVGATAAQITFPLAFDGVPQGLFVQLVVPAGQGSFTITPHDLTATGFTVDLGAAVPVSGYKLSVQAFRYNQTFTIDLEEGAASQLVVFTTPFPSVPRGLKATLQPPLPDGYEFTTALVVKSLTAESFTLEFGATVPGPNYKALIQVSL